MLRQYLTLYKKRHLSGGGGDMDAFIKCAEFLFRVVDNGYLASLARGNRSARVLDINAVATRLGALDNEGHITRIGIVEYVALLVPLKG